MLLDELFVSNGLAPSSRIHVVGTAGPPTEITAHGSSGADLLAQVIVLNGSLAVRLCRALTLRVRVARATRRLDQLGASEIRAFAAVPTLESPAFLYELGTPAATYASVNLQLGHRASLAWIRTILATCMGCDPAAGAVIVIGRRS
jgi:hypothetical protein